MLMTDGNVNEELPSVHIGQKAHCRYSGGV